ncbi:hypothetical protein ACFL43_01425 [Thermodesulfobacteriota bacterium]
MDAARQKELDFFAGIADLIIARNAIQNRLRLYTFDKHFSVLAKHTTLQLY